MKSHRKLNAAKSIGQRGVQLVATVHGKTLQEVLERGILVGDAQL